MGCIIIELRASSLEHHDPRCVALRLEHGDLHGCTGGREGGGRAWDGIGMGLGGKDRWRNVLCSWLGLLDRFMVGWLVGW